LNVTTKKKRPSEILITTLGVEPQVVTITLDYLLAAGKKIGELAVVYTENPRIQQSLEVIEDEFVKDVYHGISFRGVPASLPAGPIKDLYTSEDLRGFFRTLYAEVRHSRQANKIVNMGISGGRKVMGIMGMVVAQLLFGQDDRVWYLLTEGWQPGANRQLHLPSEEKGWLISIPVLRWSEATALMQTVAELDDPAEIMIWYEKLNRTNKIKRRREFIRRWLTMAEKDVVRLACQGLDNASIAGQLHKQEQTVANQLRLVYEKLREWLEYPAGNVDRSLLIAEFAPYFALMEEES
jgi:CRISPR-associated protein Csx14